MRHVLFVSVLRSGSRRFRSKWATCNCSRGLESGRCGNKRHRYSSRGAVPFIHNTAAPLLSHRLETSLKLEEGRACVRLSIDRSNYSLSKYDFCFLTIASGSALVGHRRLEAGQRIDPFLVGGLMVVTYSAASTTFHVNKHQPTGLIASTYCSLACGMVRRPNAHRYSSSS